MPRNSNDVNRVNCKAYMTAKLTPKTTKKDISSPNIVSKRYA